MSRAVNGKVDQTAEHHAETEKSMNTDSGRRRRSCQVEITIFAYNLLPQHTDEMKNGQLPKRNYRSKRSARVLQRQPSF